MTAQQVQDIMAQGQADAEAAVSNGEGVSVDHLIQFYKLKKTSDKRVSNMNLGEFLEAKQAGHFAEELDFYNDSFFQKFLQ